MIVLAEITAAVDAAGTLQTFYLSSGPFCTAPTDTPANQPFVPALSDPGTLEVSVYGGGRVGGYGQLSPGTLEIVNADGRFDAWKDYGFDGRKIVLRMYQAGVAYASMPLIMTLTCSGPPQVTRQKVTLPIRDKAYIFDLPACTNLFGGTNTLPNGIDGTSSDIKGQRQPRTLGLVRNVSPVCVNTSKEIYRVNDAAVAAIPGVYVRGSAYTLDTSVGTGGDVANNSTLQSTAPAAGKYCTCLAEGLFRLNDSLAGTITADVTQGASSANRTAAQIIKALGLSAGLSSGEISAADVTALDAAQSATLGIYLTANVTFRDAINRVAQAVGGYAVFDTTGLLRMGRLTDPALSGATPALTLTESQDVDFERVEQKDGDVPIFQVQLNHTPNWTQQGSDIAGGVSLARQAFLRQTSLTWNVADTSVKSKFALADTLVVDSLIDDLTAASSGPADTEANRLLTLFKTKRDLYEVTASMSLFDGSLSATPPALPSLMSLITLQSSRYGLAAGKNFWLLGIRIELARNQVLFTCWG